MSEKHNKFHVNQKHFDDVSFGEHFRREGRLRTKLYDNRDDFDFPRVMWLSRLDVATFQ
jgi:hypothetical protein